MYQIKYQGGWEIQVIGSGINGLCRIMHRDEPHPRHQGGYTECCEWLHDRGIAALGRAVPNEIPTVDPLPAPARR